MNDSKLTEEKFVSLHTEDYPSINLEIAKPKQKLNEKLLMDQPNSEDRLDSNVSEDDQKENEIEFESNVKTDNTKVRGSFFGNIQKPNFNKFVANIVASPFEDTDEDEEVEEEEDTKVKFNEKVSELAQYYINEDEISAYYFNQFFETVIIHLIYFVFGPLSVPFLFRFYGRNFIINMGFYGKKVGSSHIIQISYWVTFVLTTIFTSLILTSDKTSAFFNQYIFLCPAYVSLTMILIRYIIVCAKYAFFPPEYYKKLKNSRLTRTEVKSNFLLQGWIKPSVLVLDVYLKEIFQKSNINVDKFKFQCMGSMSNSMKEEMNSVDRVVDEDAKRIRQSLFRRIKKKDKFSSMINDIISRYKIKEKVKSRSSNEEIMSKKKILEIELHQISEVSNDCDEELNEVKKKSKEGTIENSKSLQTNINLSPAIKKFRNFYFKKLLPVLKNTIKKQVGTKEEKFKYKNEYVYELKGFYLCRAILKNVFTVNLETYSTLHKILVSLLVLVPFIFTFMYYYYFNDFLKILTQPSSTSTATTSCTNSTITNTTASTTTIDSNNLKFTINYLSIIFLVFSFFSMIPPTWLNTLNLLYGVIDINRRNKLMKILTEIFNTNIKFEKRIFPLINILHEPSLLNWYALRYIFMSYGKRFGDRILFQTSIYCVFVILSVLVSFLSLFGIFKPFISMCCGISFIFSIFINFAIIFLMYLAGAELNYFEYFHNDLFCAHRLFIDELNDYQKVFRSSSNPFNNGKLLSTTEINEETTVREESVKSLSQSNLCYSTSKRTNTITQSNFFEDKKMIFNNNNSDIYIKSILCDEHMLRQIEKNDLFFRLNRVLENMREKVMIDSIIRPLKIFWVKADYLMVGKIVAIIGTGVGLIASIFLKGLNLPDIISS